jgi:hypothetical protein
MIKFVGIFLTVLSVLAIPSTQDGPITAGETRIVNTYPIAIRFVVGLESTAAAIDRVELRLTVRGARTTSIHPAEFVPRQKVVATVDWETWEESVPHGMPVQYVWNVYDEAGNNLTTEPEDLVVMDPRFDWQMLENEDLALWWYEGDEEFGQLVFESAAQALASMQETTGLSLPHRLHVVLYADAPDFDSWHHYPREWVGGEAFLSTGLTAQIVPPRYVEQTDWLDQVIPHEIAHLFFYQITHTPLAASPPTWLVEGFAQYYEAVPHEWSLMWVERAAKRGELIPLRLLSGTFTGDEERISLMYDESLSAVTFLFEEWGEVGMESLLSALKDAKSAEEALLEATGSDLEAFQQAWWEWLGGTPGMYPTRVAIAERQAPPAVWVVPPIGTPTPTSTSTAGPEATAVPIELPTVTPPPTVTPSPTPTGRPVGQPQPIGDATMQDNGAPGMPCLGVVGLVIATVVLGWRRPG